jgi:hypothetical protein
MRLTFPCLALGEYQKGSVAARCTCSNPILYLLQWDSRITIRIATAATAAINCPLREQDVNGGRPWRSHWRPKLRASCCTDSRDMTKGGECPEIDCAVFQRREENGERAGFTVDPQTSSIQSKAAAAFRLASE